MGDCQAPSAPTRIQASPRAPSSFFTKDSSRSTSPRESASASCTGRHFTMPPRSTASRKARKPLAAKASVRSASSSRTRVSGLSLPKRAMHSAQERRGKGRGSSIPAASRAPRTVSSSSTASTSSTPTKDISRSTWVNSNWRSARCASSRKQRLIWK